MPNWRLSGHRFLATLRPVARVRLLSIGKELPRAPSVDSPRRCKMASGQAEDPTALLDLREGDLTRAELRKADLGEPIDGALGSCDNVLFRYAKPSWKARRGGFEAAGTKGSHPQFPLNLDGYFVNGSQDAKASQLAPKQATQTARRRLSR
jgi:hypothetical protein